MTRWHRAVASCFRFLILTGLLAFSAGIGIVGVVTWQVFWGDYTSLKKSTILTKIKEETTLYYLDESTRIGSIFESRHRKYVPIEDIPAHMINAIVAAEDKNFYEHVGVDPISIAKAAVDGVLAGGRFRRGGSTITQQTVKNIIDDWEASFARKFREMIKALQLERMYSKRQILEFYLNQFHVSGNGAGVGVSAKYYFNKDVQDLSLIEAAFIAGSVKGPSKYNPFIKYSKKARAKAKGYANERKNYVLRRMYEQGWISREDYVDGSEQMVPFNRGEFRTTEVALVELIKSQLKKTEILEALGIQTIDDLNVSGLRVFTTIDADLQKSAQLSMRKSLSRTETMLSGFAAESESRFKSVRHLKADEFSYGRVEEVIGTGPENYRIRLSFGLPTGEISHASLFRYAKLLDFSEGKGWKFQLQKMIDQIKIGQVLFTQVTKYDKESNHAVCELRKRPQVSGGMIALDKGEVRAVISGFDTLGFNRAMYAKRQPGSVFKSLVFFGALSLGWSMLDQLNNGRQVFPYQGHFYFPRPDHPTPYETTSMLWTNVMSENLASVEVGARLTEKLSFDDFTSLLERLGLSPKVDELPRDFHYRISREVGVSLDRSGYHSYQLKKAIEGISADLIFAGHDELLDAFKKMWWGRGYADEAKRLLADTETSLSRTELATRIWLLENNFIRYRLLAESAQFDWDLVSTAITSGDASWMERPEVVEAIGRFRVLTTTAGFNPELGYYRRFDNEQYSDDDFLDLVAVKGRKLNHIDVQAIWGDGGVLGEGGRAGIAMQDLTLSGLIPLAQLRALEEAFDAGMARMDENARQVDDPYKLRNYFAHSDFRIGLGLYYLVELAEHAGVFNKLEPVLSFPLGSNDVTVSEVAKLYQTFISGRTYRFYKEGPHNQINFIRRIEDRFGNILYEPQVLVHQLVRQDIAYQMRDILGKTVTHGTGRLARGELFVQHDEGRETDKGPLRIRVPAYGKTGSTNDWKTSYFAGFMPYPTEKNQPFDLDNSYVISSYVGYDFNKSMTRGRLHIYGGMAALPLWIDFAKSIIKSKKYVEYIDPFDLSVIAHKAWPVKSPENSQPALIDLPRGLILRAGGQADIETWSTTDLDRTGETYHDPFTPGSSARSVVHLPSFGFSEGRPLRRISFFKALTDPYGSTSISKDMFFDHTEVEKKALRISQEETTKPQAGARSSIGSSDDEGIDEDDIW